MATMVCDNFRAAGEGRNLGIIEGGLTTLRHRASAGESEFELECRDLLDGIATYLQNHPSEAPHAPAQAACRSLLAHLGARAR